MKRTNLARQKTAGSLLFFVILSALALECHQDPQKLCTSAK